MLPPATSRTNPSWPWSGNDARHGESVCCAGHFSLRKNCACCSPGLESLQGRCNATRLTVLRAPWRENEKLTSGRDFYARLSSRPFPSKPTMQGFILKPASCVLELRVRDRHPPAQLGAGRRSKSSVRRLLTQLEQNTVNFIIKRVATENPATSWIFENLRCCYASQILKASQKV